MRRPPVPFGVALFLFASGMLLLAFGWMAPGPPRVNIRWSPQTTEQERHDAERALRLTAGIFRGERTWSYLLLDTSPANVGRIVDSPAVEDRHYFGPGRTLAPEAPPLQAWFQARYGRPPVRWLTASWWFVGPALCVGAVIAASAYLPVIAATSDVRLAALLAVSAALRVWLIFSGGQYYWPDEKRYRGAGVLLTAILSRNRAAVHDLLDSPAEMMVKVAGLAPAAVERVIGENPRVPALFFGAGSVVSIWLVAAIARRLGATRNEAFVAALLAAASTVLFYVSRHLLSYDLALMAGLIGAFVGVNRARAQPASLLTAIWAVASFLIYTGAWALAVAVCVVHIVDATSLRDAFGRALRVVIGAAIAVGAILLGYRAAGIPFVRRLSTFSAGVTQGAFAEGWRLPFDYLWHAEHLLLVLWLLAVAFCVVRLSWTAETRMARAGLAGAATVYASLVIASAGLHRFVVYGRLVRPMVPFLCLAAAAVVGELVNRYASGRARTIALGAIIASVSTQAAIDFRVPLGQEFPVDFIARVERQYPAPRVFINARHLYPGPEKPAIPRGYREVASARHPLQFEPYQYEGYTPEERQRLRSEDIRMRAFVAILEPPRTRSSDTKDTQLRTDAKDATR